MTVLPPPRYRVVEEGRRLSVVDTWAEGGRPSSQPGADRDADRPGGLRTLLPTAPVTTKFDGSARLTTHRFYDEKGRRTIDLDPVSAAIVGRVRLGAIVAALAFVLLVIAAPWAIVLPFVFGQKAVRERVRGWITRWLDGVERGSSRP